MLNDAPAAVLNLVQTRARSSIGSKPHQQPSTLQKQGCCTAAVALVATPARWWRGRGSRHLGVVIEVTLLYVTLKWQVQQRRHTRVAAGRPDACSSSSDQQSQQHLKLAATKNLGPEVRHKLKAAEQLTYAAPLTTITA